MATKPETTSDWIEILNLKCNHKVLSLFYNKVTNDDCPRIVSTGRFYNVFLYRELKKREQREFEKNTCAHHDASKDLFIKYILSSMYFKCLIVHQIFIAQS